MDIKGDLVRHSHYIDQNATGSKRGRIQPWALHPKYMVINKNVDVNEKGEVQFPGFDNKAEVEYIGQHLPAQTVVILTLVAGGLFGIILLCFFFKWARRKLRERHQEASISHNMGMRGNESMQQVHNCNSAWFIPFEMPIELFKIVFPYQTMVKSLPQYFSEQYRPLNKYGNDESKSWYDFFGCFKSTADQSKEDQKGELAAKQMKSQTRQQSIESNPNDSNDMAGIQRKGAEAKQIQQAESDKGLKLVKAYKNQGIPLQQFKDRYHAYCFENMMKEESRDRHIRKFLIADMTNPLTDECYKILLHDAHIIANVTIDQSAVEIMEVREQLDIDPHATLDTLVNIVSTIETGVVDGDFRWPADGPSSTGLRSCSDVTCCKCVSCVGCSLFTHSEMMHDTGARCFLANHQTFVDMLEDIHTRDRSALTTEQKHKECWNDLILAMFTAMFCRIDHSAIGKEQKEDDAMQQHEEVVTSDRQSASESRQGGVQSARSQLQPADAQTMASHADEPSSASTTAPKAAEKKEKKKVDSDVTDKDGNKSCTMADFAVALMKFEDMLGDGAEEDSTSNQTTFKIKKPHMLAVLDAYIERNEGIVKYLKKEDAKGEEGPQQNGGKSGKAGSKTRSKFAGKGNGKHSKNGTTGEHTNEEHTDEFEQAHATEQLCNDRGNLIKFQKAVDAGKGVREILDPTTVFSSNVWNDAEHVALPMWQDDVKTQRLKDSLKIMHLKVENTPSATRKVIADLRPASAKERSAITWVYIKHTLRDITVQLFVLVILPVFCTLAIAATCQYYYSISDGAAEYPQSGQECFFGQARNVIRNFPSDGIMISRTYEDPIKPPESPTSGLYMGVKFLIFGILCTAGALCARIFMLEQLFVMVRRAMGRSKNHKVDEKWYKMKLDRLFVKFVVKVFAIAMLLWTYLCCSWFGVFAIWTAFSAILDPEKNLAKGIILVVVVTVVSQAVTKLLSLRSYVKKLTNERTDLVLKKKVEACLKEQKKDSNQKTFLKSLDSHDGGQPDMGNLFRHILEKHADIGSPKCEKDAASEPKLNFDQFVMLFQELKMAIPLERVHRMFIYCDVDNDGVMTTDEFTEAWEYLRETIAQVMMVKLGLDDSAIIKHILTFLAIFSVCIPLFLLMIALWDQSSSFVSITQSFFIGATGVFASNRTDKNHDEVKESKKGAGQADGGTNAKKDGLVTRIDNVISRFMT